MVGVAQFANTVSFGLGTLPDFDSSKIVLAGSGGPRLVRLLERGENPRRQALRDSRAEPPRRPPP